MGKVVGWGIGLVKKGNGGRKDMEVRMFEEWEVVIGKIILKSWG